MNNLKMFPLLMKFQELVYALRGKNKLKIVVEKDPNPRGLEMTADFQVSMKSQLQSHRECGYLEDLNFSMLNPMVGTMS